MRIDDFICLGRTVPEESKKYGLKVCMAGVSPELRQLMRVYPLPLINPIKARHPCVMELVRNPHDCRPESWKLADRVDGIKAVSHDPLSTDAMVRALRPFLAESIASLNRARRSLGVLEVKGDCVGRLIRREDVDPDQGLLFDVADEHFGERSPFAPYLDFFDQAGDRHRLQLREWGAHEWIRKQPDRASQLWQNLGLKGHRVWLVVGNMNNRRNVWLVVKTFTSPRIEQGSLIFDEGSDGDDLGSDGRLSAVPGIGGVEDPAEGCAPEVRLPLPGLQCGPLVQPARSASQDV